MKRAFISFDFDHDMELRGSLVAQAQDPNSPFEIADRSVHEPFSESWRRQIRGIIQRADLVIFICGEHTHDARGVSAEMTITQEENKPYFLLWGRPDRTCNKPKGALSTDRIYRWSWSNLKDLIAGAR